MSDNLPTQVESRAGVRFVETPGLKAVIERAMLYLNAGLPINLSGPSGIGKTTLALHLGHLLKRPVVLIPGDEELGSGDMSGGLFGYRRRRVIDTFVHTVRKTEDDLLELWADSRLTAACRNGYTLVYDEFTRSRPEANNALLSVLEEGMLFFSNRRGDESYVPVDPRFRAIFTSNPLEYSGTHRSPDALLDRLVTLHLDYYDEETETAITASRSGLDRHSAGWIVRLVRLARAHPALKGRVSTRACLKIAQVMHARHTRPDPNDRLLYAICRDVLGSAGDSIAEEEEAAIKVLWDRSFEGFQPPERGRKL